MSPRTQRAVGALCIHPPLPCVPSPLGPSVLQEETKFEASGIAKRGEDQYFVACDK